jgi:chemotaxis protein MotC
MKWTPKFSLPKFSRPKLSLPKPRLPKFSLPKFAPPRPALPKLALLNSRKLIIGASAMALIVAGGLAWFFVRPMLAKPETPQASREAAAETASADKAPEKPAQPKAESQSDPASSNAREEKQAAAPLPPPEPLDEPERLIRRLQDLQERVAAGDAASYAEQPRLLHLIARRFEAQPPEIWAKKQDARALILYLLSGGVSTVGRAILAAHSFAPTEAPLAKGAIAYLEGVEGADRDGLLDLDPLALDFSLGAHVAFVQSILLTNADRAKATARLDQARLLAAGRLGRGGGPAP